MSGFPARAPRTATIAAALSCLLSALTPGCGEQLDGQVSIHLVLSCNPNAQEILEAVDTFCIAIERPDGQTVEGRTCSNSLEKVRLKAQEYLDPVVVVVTGWEREDTSYRPLYRGQSPPVQLVSGEKDDVLVPFSPVGEFGLLAAHGLGCAPLPIPLVHHAAVVFPSGHLLLIGSSRSSITVEERDKLALLIDTVTNDVASIDTPVSFHRRHHTASLLENAEVLIAGGTPTTGWEDLRELMMLRGGEPMLRPYDRTTDYVTPIRFETPPDVLREARGEHAASVFFDDRVLINDGRSEPEMFMLKDQLSGWFEVRNQGGVGQAFPTTGSTTTVVPYDANLALLLGGQADRVGKLTVDEDNRYANYEGYLARVSNRDKPVGVALPNRRVMFLGRRVQPFRDDSEALVIDADALDGNLDDQDAIFQVRMESGVVLPDVGFAATLLADGRVLVVGGETADGEAVDSVLIEPSDDQSRWTAKTGPALRIPRRDHTVSRLPDGRVVVLGGNPAGGGTIDPAFSVEVIAF